MRLKKRGIISVFLANAVLSYFPSTRLFKIKARILFFLGYDIHKTARIAGKVRIIGRGGISIGQDTWIGVGCKFYVDESSNISVGNYCDLAPEVILHTGTHQVSTIKRRAGVGINNDILIGDYSWVGLRSTIISGAMLPDGVIVGAAALVLNNTSYEANTLYAGVPIKKIKPL